MQILACKKYHLDIRTYKKLDGFTDTERFNYLATDQELKRRNTLNNKIKLLNEVRKFYNKIGSISQVAKLHSISRQKKNASFNKLDFEDRFGMIVDAEWTKRQSTKLSKFIRSAGFRYPDACIEDIEYHEYRRLSKHQILEVSTCRFIGDGHHIILEETFGNGKTYIDCAPGNAACRSYFKIHYIHLRNKQINYYFGHGILYWVPER